MNLETKTVSVVIATRNRAASVAAAVESVLAQKHRDLEVIVVDDGSSDDTESVLAAINDPRLRHAHQEHHGRTHACNRALGMAVGDYISFLDPDDRYLPKKLTLQLNYLQEHPDVGMVYTTATAVDGEGNPLERVSEPHVSGEVYAAIAFGTPVTILYSTVMVRREVLDTIGPFDERMDYFEEIDLWRRIAKHCRVDAIQEPTCEVLSPSDSTVGSQDPTEILAAYTYYADKVDREDAHIDSLIRSAGLRRLGEHAAATFRSAGCHPSYVDLLRQQAGRHFRPKVSVVIPVYNGANYVGQAIRSALDQTYENIEVIVVNDGSNDDGATERVVTNFGDRVRYVAQENGGVATALNRGIEEMTGDYFSWLSHDDLYVPEKLDVQVRALSQMPDPRKQILYSDYEVFTENPASTKPFFLPPVSPRDFRYFITISNGLHGCTLLVPRQAFEEHGRFDPALRTTQDYDLWFRMATTYSFVHEPVILVRARRHPEQGTLSMSEIALRECNALLAGFAEQLSDREVRQNTTTSLGAGFLRLAKNFETRGFAEASARVSELARERLPTESPDLWQPSMDRDYAAREIARLSEEVDLLRWDRNAFESEARELRQRIELLYRSRSWRVTAPLRYAARLVEKITR